MAVPSPPRSDSSNTSPWYDSRSPAVTPGDLDRLAGSGQGPPILPFGPDGASQRLGLTVDASDLRRAGGYLSRQGPATLRWALFEAAHNASRCGSPDHAYCTAVKDRHDGKPAAISVARKFARRCYHLLRNIDPDVVYAIPA